MSVAALVDARTEASGAAASAATQAGAPRIAALDGLRAIAVLLVVAMHYLVIPPGPENSAAHAFSARLFSLSFCGVDLFFVLSGYFIGGILLDHRGSTRLLSSFYLRRLFRIVPLYLLLLASFFVCREIAGLAAVNRGTYFWSSVPDWSYFVFGQNIAMATLRDIGPYWLGVTWSLAVEEQFYLLLPLIVLRIDSRQLVRACLFLIVLSPVLRTIALFYAQNTAAAVFLLPMRADGLLWGVVCAVTMRNADAVAWFRHRRQLIRTMLIAMTGLLIAFSLGKHGADSVPVATYGYSALSLYFALVLLYVAIFSSARLATALSVRPLAKIGLTSYFIYLFHTPIWYLLHWLFFRWPPLHFTWTSAAVTFLALFATVGLALGSWRYFEVPLLRFARRFSYR